MRKSLFVFFAACFLGGCCSSLKESVRQYSTTIHEQAEVGLESLKRCRNGEAPACTGAEGNLKAMDESAKRIQNSVK